MPALQLSSSPRISSWHIRRVLGTDSGELPSLFPKPREVFGMFKPLPTPDDDTKDLGHDKKRSLSGLLGPWVSLVARRPETPDTKSKRDARLGGRDDLDFVDFDLA